MGDPVSLINLLLPVEPSPKYKVGIIPHAYNVDAYRQRLKKEHSEYSLIDPRADFHEVLSKINECHLIASQSLHGLVVADAYSIPNVWIEPSQSMIGGEFKFLDYYTSMDGEPTKTSLDDLLGRFDKSVFDVRAFKGRKDHYLEYIKSSLA